ncbi:hypothetical protein PybrP1_010809 [[Pythium] brassicae (nom. inval.)]|nr:hypothetical protein PybrP1_010809 [[Pythium] brassicae (nom. inval.)]
MLTKFDNAECTKLQKESLKCLLENEDTRENCTAFFDRYKRCLQVSGVDAVVLA